MGAVMHLFAPLSHGHGVEQTICDDGDTCQGTNLHKKLIQSRKTLEVLKDELDGTEEGSVDASHGEQAPPRTFFEPGLVDHVKEWYEDFKNANIYLRKAKKAVEKFSKTRDAKTKEFRAKLAVENLKKATKEENAVEKAFEKLLA